MDKKVEIIRKQEVFKQAIFRIEAAELRHEKYDGTMSDTMTRLSFERGDSVAAVIHDPQDDRLIFTEQFRYPTVEKGPGWLLEIPAGVIDADEHPTDAMRRELVEEIGYQVHTLHHISTFYLSPGGSSERIHLFYARVGASSQVAAGGGVAGEHEDIRTVSLSVQRVLSHLWHGGLEDAKTIIGLQWFQINMQNLPGSDESRSSDRN
jgi:nudix-type nucleoside diphosphatase (YffH/AdpP family)